MKRYSTKFIFTVLALGSLMLGSCGKEEEPATGNNGGGTKTNTVTATINGKALNTETIIAEYENTGVIDITANDKDQVTILSLYFDVNGPDNQTFDGANTFGAAQTSATAHGLYQAESGTLTLTKNDKAAGIVEGTFNFSARNINNDVIAVTGGTFYVKYNK